MVDKIRTLARAGATDLASFVFPEWLNERELFHALTHAMDYYLDGGGDGVIVGPMSSGARIRVLSRMTDRIVVLRVLFG
jgi:hypothetical protein